MALSNYLTHSIVCTTLFYGYGFGLFGEINRTGLAAIVLMIWVSQLSSARSGSSISASARPSGSGGR